MAKKNILVLEDERPLLEAIKKKLALNGFDVVTAREVEQAYNYIKEMDIDAIWVDHYLLGKESGLDFVAKCKSDDSDCRDVPIYVVSNTASADKVQAYMRFGVSKYYTKSNHRLDEIIEEIVQTLENQE